MTSLHENDSTVSVAVLTNPEKKVAMTLMAFEGHVKDWKMLKSRDNYGFL